eukprot:TRINITY_DN19284_c0_g1_i1.p1 TRINITY_DN19284_c0_g1~~TRINITY_DN19284_c0_g1_i1.p1  ORF type:complete len:467 (-),score=52.83 TRINITY_DN19284_c0_g1_i1:82-1482(-)
MHFAQHIAEFAEKDVSCNEHLLYCGALADQNANCRTGTGPQYYRNLWKTLAPGGNIYNFNGLQAERRRHAADLWAQLEEIAEEFRDLLGGDVVPLDDRAQELYELLQTTDIVTDVQYADGDEPPLVCFTPFDEFLHKVKCWGPVVMPVTHESRVNWLIALLLAFCIFGIQILAPTVLFLRGWASLRVYCSSDVSREVLDKILGSCILVVSIAFIRVLVDRRAEDAEKVLHVPVDWTWSAVGAVANIYCASVSALVLPMLFLSAKSCADFVINSMVVLFVLSLDDLAGLGGFLRLLEDDFHRVAAWHYLLLAHCPVRLRDIVNRNAIHKGDLWQLRLDNQGRFLAMGLIPQVPRHSEAIGPRHVFRSVPAATVPVVDASTPLCLTRITRVVDLVRGTRSVRGEVAVLADNEGEFRYYTAPGCFITFPDAGTRCIWTAWFVAQGVLLLFNVALPLTYLAADRRCPATP